MPISPQVPSLDYINAILKTHTGITNLNNTNWKDFDAKNYIYFSDNLINDIYKNVSKYRNIYLVEIIKEKTKQYGKVFVMVGFDHAKGIKEDLDTIFQNI